MERASFEFHTTSDEFGRLVTEFFEYCAGRQTYAPSICERVIADNADIIPDPYRARMIAKVEGAYAHDMPLRAECLRKRNAAKEAGDPEWWAIRANGQGPETMLGADFDEDGWVSCIRRLERSDIRREVIESSWDGTECPVTAVFGDADDFWFMIGSCLRRVHASGGDELVGPGMLTDVVRRTIGDINEKWVWNLSRDLGDELDAFMAEKRGTDLSCWDDLHAMLSAVPA